MTSSGYLHAHDDKSNMGHSHFGLDILTAGPSSSADSLHTHDLFVLDSELDTRITQVVNSMRFDQYVRKDGSINQLADIQSTGDKFESAVLKMHDKIHTIESHGTIATAANLDTLVNGSNADCLHTHNFSIEGITAIHNELEGLQGGGTDQYYHFNLADYTEVTNFFHSTDITGAEAETLTNGSNADALHTHSGTGCDKDHNELNGLQGGTSYDPSIFGEYYHLDYNQYITLTGGPSVYADDLHTHDLGGHITVQDEGVDVCTAVTIINFKGATVQAKDCINGKVNVYVPPPSYVSHFDTTDGTNNCSVADISVTTRYVSAPTSEGTPFNIGNWTAGTTHGTIGSSLAAISYTSTNACSFVDNSSATIEANVYDADGISILATHTTASITGNTDVTVDNIRIRVTSWAVDSDMYKGIITVNFNIDTIIVANGLDSGRFSVEIIHHDGGDGDFTFTQNDVFYDDQSQTQAMGNVTIAENTPVIVYKSGVMAYDTGSTFSVAIDDFDYLNTESYPQPFARIVGTEYGLSTLNLSGGNLTGWTNAWNNTNSSYSNSLWAVSTSNYFIRTTTANVTAQTIDWGAWGESSDVSPDASIIVDTYNDNSTGVYEDFRGETNRLQSNLSTPWVSATSLASIDGGTGLQVGEGTYLFYPGNSALSPAFPTSSGDYTDYAPNSVTQPDYSALSGTRYYYRGVWHSGTAHSNGLFNITGVTEANITADAIIIEISLDGSAWFNCNEAYLGGVLSDGSGCRINSGSQNMTLNGNLQFTLGTGGFTAAGTGPGWGMWIKISMPDTSTVSMNKIEITDWT
jgi:hypothetical protein